MGRVLLVLGVEITIFALASGFAACGSGDGSVAKSSGASPAMQDGATDAPLTDTSSLDATVSNRGANSDAASDATTTMPTEGSDSGDEADAADADVFNQPMFDAASIDAGTTGIVRTGTVFLSQSISTTYATNASAAFTQVTGRPPPGNTPCVSTNLADGCTFVRCASGANGDAGAQAGDSGVVYATSNETAGTVTIVPTAANAVVLSLDGGSTQYISVSGSTRLFSRGDRVSFHAQGSPGMIGPFVATVLAPGDVSITAPTMSNADGRNSFTFPRSTDFTTSWIGGTPGTQMIVELGSSGLPTDDVRVLTCSFDAAAGTAVIASADLEMLQKTDGQLIFGYYRATPTSAATIGVPDVSGNHPEIPWVVETEVEATGQSSAFTNSD